MFGTFITLVGLGGILYISLNENSKNKNETKVTSINISNDSEKNRLNILKERYSECYIAIENLYNNDIFDSRSSYSSFLTDTNSLNKEIHNNLEKIIVTYLNKGVITKEDEKTKRLLHFLDLLVEQHLKIVKLNKVLDLYDKNTIPNYVLEEINTIVKSLLDEYINLDNKLNNEAKERALELLNSIKENKLSNEDSKGDLNLRLSEDSLDSIGNTTTNLKSLMSEEDWKD